MKRQDKAALLLRILEGKVTQEELSRQMNPDPESISVVIISEGAKDPEPDELVTATLTFHGSRGGKTKTMPFKVLEKLMARVGGTVFSLPDNHRNDE
ncbi:hypothetical protein BWI93_04525 [Siphonobacter sp. BAB-5385]|uniref:hypothetical protein n=1 Tax=Siphonobacter sp. BAB-5385 TaxID=1864822 RepID=UPI000B9EA893|nr:hypothetical protein [Siphonobacter sp. BAB-5385]OZI09329.1 hypothetical protein BWI93_04525 [Siphonobacter sp. BAB-5385]